MFKYPAVANISVEEFEKKGGDLSAKYGLPAKVIFCKKCVISNQRPNSTVEYKHTKESRKETIHFNEEGICDACLVAEQKKNTINWEERDKELRDLCDRFRKGDGSYDCIVPGSGGKDSVYTAHILKVKYGMHPLTVTWAPHIYTDWGRANFNAWIHAGFDNILHTPNGRVHRLLTRLSVENIFHPFQPFFFGQKSIAPKLSILYNIPLVFYGENEAEYGNPVASMKGAQQDWNYFTAPDKSSIFLGGASLAELKESFGVDEADFQPYMPANPELLLKTKTEVHYLGYYLKWHPQSCYYYAVDNLGFQASPERTAGTYSKYSGIDDKIDDFHYYTTFIKFGIGRATYDAAQEIRSGDITREEGVSLVKRFDGEFPERFAKEIFTYLSIPKNEFPIAHSMFESPTLTRDYFLHLVDQFRSPHIWKKNLGEWELRNAVWK